MPWSEWLGAIAFVLLALFVGSREGPHAAIEMLSVGIFAGILLIYDTLLKEVRRRLNERMPEKKQ